MIRQIPVAPVVPLSALVIAACSPTVASVVPAGGATGVDPKSAIVIQFTRSMSVRTETSVALHEETVAGLVVPGTWSWSADRTRLTFAPASPLRSQTPYALHLGGGMKDANGNLIDLDRCVRHGGRWATPQMMSGASSMTGPEWEHVNRSYGVLFAFTTG